MRDRHSHWQWRERRRAGRPSATPGSRSRTTSRPRSSAAPRRQPGLDQRDGRQARARLLHDGGVRRRRDRADRGAGDARRPRSAGADNLGTRPEFKLEGTPLAIKGVLYATAGTRRSVVALDGRTGELIWVAQLPRRQPRRDRAAPAVGPRRLVLDRRQGRRAHPLRDDRLSPDRAQREERRDDPDRSARAASST